MGMSASQARLLTITSRLTANEYESQQISNSKLSLSSKSQEASEDYIKALNSTQLKFVSYDGDGTTISQNLTAGTIYQYSELKNQYALINSSGQIMMSSSDAQNYEKSSNLDEFLACYGITENFKTSSLEENYYTMADNKKGYDAYLEELAKVKEQDTNGYYTDYLTNVSTQSINFSDALDAYNSAVNKYGEGLISRNTVTEYEYEPDGVTPKYEPDGVTPKIKSITYGLDHYIEELGTAKSNYEKSLNFADWYSSNHGTESENYSAYQVYKNASEELENEYKSLGLSNINDCYDYNDENKASWYTNLWYRINGSYTTKSSQGKQGQTYSVLDSNLLTSQSWLQHALTQGIVTLEVGSSSGTKQTKDGSFYSLMGITWKSTEYAQCSDFQEEDNEEAVTKASAEYERKTSEIEAKEKKYDNKLKTLETEHEAIKTEYESVQSAMNENVKRSFKAFS